MEVRAWKWGMDTTVSSKHRLKGLGEPVGFDEVKGADWSIIGHHIISYKLVGRLTCDPYVPTISSVGLLGEAEPKRYVIKHTVRVSIHKILTQSSIVPFCSYI